MQAFLIRKGHTTAADSMGDIINPARPTLAYAGLGCEVSLRLFWAYAGKGSAMSPPSGTGLFPNPTPGSTPGCNASPRTLMSLSEPGGDGLHYDYRRSATGGGGSGGVPPPLSPPMPPSRPASVGQHQHQQGGSPDGASSAKRRRAGPSAAGAAGLWPSAGSTGGGRRAPQGSVQADPRGTAPREGGAVGRASGGGGGGDREAEAGGGHEDGCMPLFDIPFPAGTKFGNSGPIAPVTSMGLDGDQHALSFDLGGPGGADAFFHLGQKTDIAMAATAERVGGPSNESGMMGGGNGCVPAAAAATGGGQGRVGGESESARIPRQHQHQHQHQEQ